MSSNSSQQGNNSGPMEMIIAIIVIVALFFLFRYVWHGIVWAFNQYVDLLRVK